MPCVSERGEAHKLKVEGNVGADPIWCSQCGHNLDLVNIPLSKKLRTELLRWGSGYGKWIDWDKDELARGGIEMEDEHNNQGAKLTEKAKRELSGQYRVKFSPSTIARSYANNKR